MGVLWIPHEKSSIRSQVAVLCTCLTLSTIKVLSMSIPVYFNSPIFVDSRGLADTYIVGLSV